MQMLSQLSYRPTYWRSTRASACTRPYAALGERLPGTGTGAANPTPSGHQADVTSFAQARIFALPQVAVSDSIERLGRDVISYVGEATALVGVDTAGNRFRPAARSPRAEKGAGRRLPALGDDALALAAPLHEAHHDGTVDHDSG